MSKISIIIPIYNVEDYIKQALDCTINQTFKDIEIICINDCSPDKSFEIVKQYASKDSRIILLEHETNLGAGAARNNALDIANGDYIMFLDPDDWYELDACEKAYNQISTNNNDLVFFSYYTHKETPNGYKISCNKNRLKRFEDVKSNQHINLAELHNIEIPPTLSWCQIYSKEFINTHNIRFSNERYGEDLQFFIKSWINAKNVSVLDEPIYNYRVANTKAKNINYANYFEHILSTKQTAYQTICKSENKETFLKQFIPYLATSDSRWLKHFSYANPKIKKDFYNKVKLFYSQIHENITFDLTTEKGKYNNFTRIIRCKSLEEYLIKTFIYRICKLEV